MLEKIKQFKELLKASNKILLINHIKMDLDALGSLGALYLILKKTSKNVKAVNESTPEDSFSFLGINDIFEIDLDIKKFKPDLIITLDSGNVEQLGEIYTNNKEVFDITPTIVIDHHPTNVGYGTINIIEPNISSTCELVYILLKEGGYKKYIDTDIANLLLAGIITDTNAFYNKNTTPHTMIVVSELLELGANMREIIYSFFHKISIQKTKLRGLVLEKIRQKKNGKITWVCLKKRDFKKTGTTEEDVSGLIMDLLNIEGCEVAFMIYEIKKGVKVSFRSNSYDVSAIVSSFPGGGGHKLAAGFRSEKTIEQIEKAILKKLKL